MRSEVPKYPQLFQYIVEGVLLLTPLEVCPHILGQKRTTPFFFGGGLTY